MKKSDLLQYSEPMRQSYVAILIIIIKTYRIMIGQVWPVLVVFLFGSGKKGLVTILCSL